MTRSLDGKLNIIYGEGDPWVWCSNCQALLRVDAMDASCRLCGEFHVLSQDKGEEVIKEFQKPQPSEKYIVVGNVIPGYAGGWFGRDSYEDKRIINIGATWVVAVDSNDNVHVAQGENVIAALEDYMHRLKTGKE